MKQSLTPAMKPLRFPSAFLILLAVTLGCHVATAGEENSQTIKFSDPTKPGTVKINLGRGELRVQGADTAEVTVKTDAKATTSEPRKDGFRVLSAASSFELRERDNLITLDTAKEWNGRGGKADFDLTVPRNTTVIVQNAMGGDIRCGGIQGDIEINSMHGEIRLDDVAGGVVVGTMNGEIRASIRELNEGKPLSFTSMNGEVVIRLPQTAKANVRLRTQNGSVLTDFEESALITKTEVAPGSGLKRVPFNKSGRVLNAEVQDAIREATQMSATAIKEALEAVKEGLEAARLDSDEGRQQMEDAKREMERARRELERMRNEQARAASRGERAPGIPAPPAPPAVEGRRGLPAMPSPKPVPTITGGKLVTGTLNGGGPEISVSSMNGDVILRKIEAK
jgi:hypothetical protein